ncbi:MAG TPA: IPExxxVDY family protein [Bacteroidales bacterium]|nr:IPExxxVDY family protein [Bacteroidales bacterium]
MMKNTNKIKRIQLNMDDNENLFLCGIVSTDPDYKLSLALNKKLGISLKNKSPLSLHDESGSELIFSRFSHTNHSDDTIYSLISNRSGKQFLLKKLKNIDYLFQVHYAGSDNNGSEITMLLRETEAVNAVFVIDTLTLNDKNLQYIIP